MRRTRPPLLSPGVKTIEVDKSDKMSVWAKVTQTGGGGGVGSGSNIQNPTPHPKPKPPITLFDFLLQEDGFFILQEDNSKIII
jgi:hypothetical protein